MKTCTICREEKELVDFNLHPHTRDGRGSQCRKCHNSEKCRRLRERKVKLVEMFGGGCSRCGYDRSVAALDFHHLGDKDVEVSAIRGWDKMLAEARKCVLLCSNCHREEHDHP